MVEIYKDGNIIERYSVLNYKGEGVYGSINSQSMFLYVKYLLHMKSINKLDLLF